MKIYSNRYQASKARRAGEIVVKVYGGYTIMSATEYRIWKAQK